MSGDPWDDYSDFDPPPAVPVGVQPEPAEPSEWADPQLERQMKAAWKEADRHRAQPAGPGIPAHCGVCFTAWPCEVAQDRPAVPVVHPEPGDRPMTHHPKCFQSTRTPEQLVAEGLAPDQCDCGTLRLLDAVTDLPDTVNLSSWMETPHRIAVDGHGYVWRAYTGESYWSMAPVNPDNSPVPQPVVYYVPESEVAAAVAAVRADREETLADRLEVITGTIGYPPDDDLDAIRPWCERVAAALAKAKP